MYRPEVGEDLQGTVHIASVSEVLQADSRSDRHHLALAVYRCLSREHLPGGLCLPLASHVSGELVRAIRELGIDELALPQAELLQGLVQVCPADDLVLNQQSALPDVFLKRLGGQLEDLLESRFPRHL